MRKEASHDVSPKELENDRRRLLKRRIRAARSARIAQFEQQQLKGRQWISFAEIIDWRSRNRSDGLLDEEKRRLVLDQISNEISHGTAFFERGRSFILMTNPLYRVSRLLLSAPSSLRSEVWLDRDRWETWRGGPEYEQIISCSWIPQSICLEWAANVPFEPKPEWTMHRLSPRASKIETEHPQEEAPPTSRHEAERRPKIKPPADQYDPDQLSHWSVAMTMAWIIWGNVGAVREQWDDYRTQCAEWKFFPNISIDAKTREAAIKYASYQEPALNDPEITRLGGHGEWKFVGLSDAGWLGLEFRARRDEIPWERMVEDLWLAAGEGKIRATAIEYREGDQSQVVEIPPHMWGRLRRTREISGKAMLSAPDRDYRDVRFSRSEVVSLWPLKSRALPQGAENIPAPGVLKLRPLIAAAEIEPAFKKWRESQNDIPTEEEDIAHMRSLGVSRQEVRKLRKKYVTRGRGQHKKRAGKL